MLGLMTLVLFSCEEAEKEVSYPDIDFYDFESAEPWFGADGLSYADGTTVVTAFDQVDQFFGSENLREVTAEVDFPEEGDWAQIGLYFRLECPENDLCDHWDRTVSVQLVKNAGTDNAETVEILRHITPYRLGMSNSTIFWGYNYIIWVLNNSPKTNYFGLLGLK